MLLVYIILVGSVIGSLFSRQHRRRRLAYALIGIVGAFIGAFLSFGDAPFLIRHPYLNPWTLSLIASTLLVAVVWSLETKVFRK